MGAQPVRRPLPARQTALVASQQIGDLRLPRAVAGHPALELCNTLAGWGDDAPKEYLTTYDHLAAWAGVLDLLPPAAVRRLRRLAARDRAGAAAVLADGRALRADLYAALTRRRPPRRALDGLTARLQDAGAASRLTWSPGGWAVEPGADGLALPVHAFASAIRRLVEDGFADRVARCPGAGCGWLFLDEGRGRRWCIMALCGNREKARRHAARQRELRAAG
jgi:predicted RNA-binding Zn ribbon-like protein